MRIWLVALLAAAMVIVGCGKEPAPTAGLQMIGEGTPGGVLRTTGEGNGNRQVRDQQGVTMTELTAGSKGTVSWLMTAPFNSGMTMSTEVMFLSTQGTGRVVLRLRDAGGRLLYEGGEVYTGVLPSGQGHWQDRRVTANYLGGWSNISWQLEEVLQTAVPAVAKESIAQVEWGVEVGQGQHVLVKRLAIAADPRQAITSEWLDPVTALQLGESKVMRLRLNNPGERDLAGFSAELLEPLGWGVICSGERVKAVPGVPAKGAVELQWTVEGRRGDEVNLGRPWLLTVRADGRPIAQLPVTVQDNRPGTVYYVMTDDLEPMDGAGYPKPWGNANGWLDPEEFSVQLIDKAEAMNRIAAMHGARWTHYIAWPAVEAAEWAAGRSKSGVWQQVTAAIRQSVREQSAAGHEYAAHLHMDYDHYVPGNVLSYDEGSDGFWANHLRHGWAHMLAEEGIFEDRSTRLGSAYTYQKTLDKLAAESGQGQIVTARVGSFDFGNGSSEEAKSTRVYRRLGLWGGSDADGNGGGITAGPFPQGIYWAAADDINRRAGELAEQGIIQFRPTPQEYISYDTQSAAVMNRKVDQGMAAFRQQGRIEAGVHAIVGFTHAMFLLGDQGWKSTAGGQFAALEEHLAYVQGAYAAQGLRFATASELVKAYLDHFSPQPIAVYGKKLGDTWLYEEYAIQVLGKDIPVGSDRTHAVRVHYPLYLRDSVYRVVVKKDGNPVMTTWGVPTDGNEVVFPWDDRQASYTLCVYRNSWLAKGNHLVHALVRRLRS